MTTQAFIDGRPVRSADAYDNIDPATGRAIGEVARCNAAQTIVYREMPTEPAVVEGPPAPQDADVSESWELDNTALFRYSALTFNGHRIHYDADYARKVEGYPNLVIHGPLLATLLLDLAARQAPPVGSFRYQARSPLVLPGSFTINIRRDDQRASLWAASVDGLLAMEAEARDREDSVYV